MQEKLRLIYGELEDRWQINDMEELATKLIHPVTGQSFCELAAEELARGVKLNPGDLPRVKRIAGYYIGPSDAKWSLPEALLLHFPGDKDLQDIIDGECAPLLRRDPNAYIDEMRAVMKRRGPRSHNDLFHAQRLAGQVDIPPGDENPADVHLWEERIDALAFLLSLFATPEVYTAWPLLKAGEPNEHLG